MNGIDLIVGAIIVAFTIISTMIMRMRTDRRNEDDRRRDEDERRHRERITIDEDHRRYEEENRRKEEEYRRHEDEKYRRRERITIDEDNRRREEERRSREEERRSRDKTYGQLLKDMPLSLRHPAMQALMERGKSPDDIVDQNDGNDDPDISWFDQNNIPPAGSNTLSGLIGSGGTNPDDSPIAARPRTPEPQTKPKNIKPIDEIRDIEI